jgi:hypothetical protein
MLHTCFTLHHATGRLIHSETQEENHVGNDWQGVCIEHQGINSRKLGSGDREEFTAQSERK